MKNSELFSPSNTIARRLIESEEYAWDVLPLIEEFIIRVGRTLPPSHYKRIGRFAYAARDARIADTAYIGGAVIIDRGAEVRHGAYIRGSAIIGRECVVGNSTEIKNSVLFDGAAAPHYNYIGDSIIGHLAHLGAGAVISNLKSDKSEVTVSFMSEKIHTGRRKMGAAVGDGVEIGCGAVLTPGTVIGKGTTVYPLVRVRGYIPPQHILKAEGILVKKEIR